MRASVRLVADSEPGLHSDSTDLGSEDAEAAAVAAAAGKCWRSYSASHLEVEGCSWTLTLTQSRLWVEVRSFEEEGETLLGLLCGLHSTGVGGKKRKVCK